MKVFSTKGKNLFFRFVSLTALIVSSNIYAKTINVQPNTIISQPTKYSNVTLDMTGGSFIIKNNAILTIENSVINGNLSKNNQVLITVDTGTLNLKNDQVNIKAVNLTQHPTTQSFQYVMQVALGTVNLDGNTFTIDKPFSAGLLITTASILTTGFNITHNTFQRFHGVLYLIGSDQAVISDNIFNKNSYGNLVTIGNNNQIIRNTIYFSGNDHLGNSMDIIDSNNVTIKDNRLFTPTCHGIYVMNSRNLLIDSNRITGGITYAMNILSYPETPEMDNYVKTLLAHYKVKNPVSTNITISNNYMGQNRFGIAASDVDGLVVTNNYFVQRFADKDARKFWTDNSILLTDVNNLSWTNNFYKEAFSQDNSGDNSKSMQLLSFPITGGVSL